MCGSKPQLGWMSRVGTGPGYPPNCELNSPCGRLNLGHSLVGHEVELVQGNWHFAFLHLAVSVFFLALFLRFGVLLPSSLYPPEDDPLQIQVCHVRRRFVFELLGLQPQRLSAVKRKGRLSYALWSQSQRHCLVSQRILSDGC